MNQTTNFTQWKNLTDDEKAAFDWSYKYELQCIDGSWATSLSKCFDDTSGDMVYRLKIEANKWYYWSSIQGQGVGLGSRITYPNILDIIRPAKPSEIAEHEPTGEQLIGLLCRESGDMFQVTDCVESTYLEKYRDSMGTRYVEPIPLSISELEDYLERAKKAGVE